MSSNELQVLEDWLSVFHDGTLVGIIDEGTKITLKVECLWLLECLVDAPAFVRLRLIGVERNLEDGLPLVDADLKYTETKDGWVASWFDYDDVATELPSFWWRLRAKGVRCEGPDGREIPWKEIAETAEAYWDRFEQRSRDRRSS